MSHTRLWDLEETPYETSDPNGALKLLTDPLYLAGLNQSAEHHPFIAKARLAIAKATGEKL